MSAANARGKSITVTPLNDLLPDGMKARASRSRAGFQIDLLRTAGSTHFY
jgi:hypothetical protein